MSSAVPTTVTGVEGGRELTLEELGGQPHWRDLPRIGVAGLVSTISALPASVQGRWVPPLLAAETALVDGAGAFWFGPWAGLTAAAAFLAGTAVLAVVALAVILVVARASPRRRLLADVTPAYVAALTLRPYQRDAGPAWYAANHTAWPRGHGHGAQLRDRVSRLAIAEHRPVVITPANPTLAAKLYSGFTPLPGEETVRRPRLVWRLPSSPNGPVAQWCNSTEATQIESYAPCASTAGHSDRERSASVP